MKLVNLTKQALTLRDINGVLVELPPDPRHVGIAGVGDRRTVTDASGHVFPLSVQNVREVKGMPDPVAGTVYIVPHEIAMVLQSERDDIVFPSEETTTRDAEGCIASTTTLRRIVRAGSRAVSDPQNV